MYATTACSGHTHIRYEYRIDEINRCVTWIQKNLECTKAFPNVILKMKHRQTKQTICTTIGKKVSSTRRIEACCRIIIPRKSGRSSSSAEADRVSLRRRPTGTGCPAKIPPPSLPPSGITSFLRLEVGKKTPAMLSREPRSYRATWEPRNDGRFDVSDRESKRTHARTNT